MKSWFIKTRISAALDNRKPMLAWWRRTVSRSKELRAAEQEMLLLDRSLRQTVPAPGAPGTLHGSIMRAVRAVESPARAQGGRSLVRWLPAPALLAGLGLIVWWSLRGPAPGRAPDTQSLAAATTALEMGGQLPETAPAAAVAPLSDELQRLNQDLQNTAQFLLASVP